MRLFDETMLTKDVNVLISVNADLIKVDSPTAFKTACVAY